MNIIDKVLIFVPTYNEAENVRPLVQQLLELGPNYEFLILDDNSPDGTGQILDALAAKNPALQVIHRAGKQGIGTAHQAGIAWAYKNNYKTLVTMDADFTHSPKSIPDLIQLSANSEVVVGSRYKQHNSLRGWNLFRKSLTHIGHWLTVFFLDLKYDATGAFRLYRLDRVPQQIFKDVQSTGYSFFFESLHLLNLNQMRISELPIALPPRTYGHSKMSYREILKSVGFLFRVWITTLSYKRRQNLNRILNKPILKKESK